MLLQKEKSALLLIDVQEKLTPYVLNSEALIARCQWMLRLASTLNVPLLASEQYPQGLGHTLEPLQALIHIPEYIDKVHFSCYRNESFTKRWHDLNKKQAVLMGIETHVCVMQTALDMKNAGIDVFVIVDAVSSRYELDHHYGLKRMKQAGIQLVTSEMVFFEWVERAGTPEFKVLSKEFLTS